MWQRAVSEGLEDGDKTRISDEEGQEGCVCRQAIWSIGSSEATTNDGRKQTGLSTNTTTL